MVKRSPAGDEVERVLRANPGLLKRLEDFERRRRRGELEPGVSHEQVRRRLGLEPPEVPARR
jgi:hypothetical protein